MRGGTIPNFLWGTGLLALLLANYIWTGNSFQLYEDIFAVVVTFTAAAALTYGSREALRKGPPTADGKLEPAPSTSLSAALVGIAIGAMLFGVVFGKFLVYMGGGLWLLAFGRLLVELRAQRRFVRRLNEGRPR
jgi:predicted MFS family arabinose efflux permease